MARTHPLTAASTAARFPQVRPEGLLPGIHRRRGPTIGKSYRILTIGMRDQKHVAEAAELLTRRDQKHVKGATKSTWITPLISTV